MSGFVVVTMICIYVNEVAQTACHCCNKDYTYTLPSLYAIDAT